MANVNSTQYEVFANPVRGKVEESVLSGRMRRALATVSVATGDGDLTSGGDKARLTWLPKGVTLQEVRVYTDGVGGASDNDLGDANTADGIADGLDLSTAAQTEVVAGGNGGSNGMSFPANANQELWEVLGYSSKKDAPTQIEVWLTANSAATGDGNIAVEFFYVDH